MKGTLRVLLGGAALLVLVACATDVTGPAPEPQFAKNPLEVMPPGKLGHWLVAGHFELGETAYSIGAQAPVKGWGHGSLVVRDAKGTVRYEVIQVKGVFLEKPTSTVGVWVTNDPTGEVIHAAYFQERLPEKCEIVKEGCEPELWFGWDISPKDWNAFKQLKNHHVTVRTP